MKPGLAAGGRRVNANAVRTAGRASVDVPPAEYRRRADDVGRLHQAGPARFDRLLTGYEEQARPWGVVVRSRSAKLRH